MKYLKNELIALALEEKGLPKIIYSEIDSIGVELRKIEIFTNGTFGYAYNEIEVGTTALADQLIPEVEEINKDEGFLANYIERYEFEALWKKYVLDSYEK